ncbi:MAG TPA: citrate/2-methylcitrate synthase [Gemmatimonadaceae bacterium]|nr:citrate/2-methylcitrate synthase [Gemmatimonadaceae bacterium]
MASTAPVRTTAGLEDVVIGTSEISDVNGQTGQLLYRGYDIHDLVEHATFEEVVFLLWYGRLPTRDELTTLAQSIARHYALPKSLLESMRTFPRGAEPMDVLRSAVSQLAFDDHQRDQKVDDRDVNLRRAERLTAAVPAIVGAWSRMREGQEPVTADPSLTLAANVSYMLTGKRPDEASARAMDIALILHADHEINASTFAARVAAATLADMYACVVAAIGTLSGPLHGGANTAVMAMLREMRQSGQEPREFIRAALAAKRKIMGFGHRVYRTEDPRATHLRRLSRELGERQGAPEWFQLSRQVEEVVKAEKGLNANVDFYSASTYHVMGIPSDLFTPLFAVSRISGWTAHVLEQYANNRLIRPRAEYAGPRGLKVVPLDRRR